jgi:hypothetical protein
MDSYDIGLRGQLKQICLEAIDAHWITIEPYMKALAFDIVREKQSWQFANALSEAINSALDDAIKCHTETTFGAVVDEMAKVKVRADLAKRLKARGLDTTLLDSIP